MGSCKHHISSTKDCPWCDRKGDKTFKAKKPHQVYQLHFGKFLENLEDNALGPARVIYCCEDLNGEMYAYVDGPKEKVKELLSELIKTLG